ncbi:chemotaxis protein CheX [Bacillus thuringiensis]|uniref:chemotaxis protein CheX n=1 Tax=Bacillus thuringiensis TaxID=1428 RepID=UPI0021D686B3|nr:chemotaxis protein CheX [Bacillus thuringiensis]MCU7667221.1 chemotaxis protein CheX [Bacillus thuringiensis]
MDVKYINAVCRATEGIFQNYFGLTSKPLAPYAGKFAVDSRQVSVILGVHGQLKGQIICSFELDTAKKIVGLMMGGIEVEEIDDMGWSAIQEFGNWIAGTSATEISTEGVIVDVTPPVVNEGNSIFRSHNIFISVPMQSDIGVIEVHISLKKD